MNGARRQGLPERAHVLVAASFTVLYATLSFLSSGFFQDDEVGHFLEAVAFWKDPSAIMGPWSRPGFKLLYVVPALAGLHAVHLVGAVFAGGVVYATGRLARAYALPNRLLVAVLCGFQPLLYQISFRTYAEIPGALLLAVALLAYEARRHALCAALCSYLFTVRQETVLLSLLLGVYFARTRRWVPLLWLAWAPVVLGVVGWSSSGDPLWIVHTFLRGGKNPGFVKPDPLHYVRAFVPIFGPTIGALFLAGLVGPLVDRGSAKRFLGRHLELYVIFAGMFALNVALSSASTVSTALGIWRNLLVLSPVVSLFAAIGFETILAGGATSKRAAFACVVALVAWVLAFGSHAHNYFAYTDAPDYTRFAAGVALLLVLALAGRMGRVATAVAIAGITIAHTTSSERPLPLSGEHRAVRDLVRFYDESGFRGRPTLVNHPMFAFFEAQTAHAPPATERATLANIRNAKPGTILIWDTHYGYRPELHADADFHVLASDASLRVVREFVAQELIFSIVLIEKQ